MNGCILCVNSVWWAAERHRELDWERHLWHAAVFNILPGESACHTHCRSDDCSAVYQSSTQWVWWS